MAGLECTPGCPEGPHTGKGHGMKTSFRREPEQNVEGRGGGSSTYGTRIESQNGLAVGFGRQGWTGRFFSRLSEPLEP
jgi:hypothetical protein